MSKAQGWILAALILTALINLTANAEAWSTLKQGHPITAGQIVDPFFLLAWVTALIVLLLVADAAPVFAGWIAGLILLGAVLQKGPQALKLGMGGKA